MAEPTTEALFLHYRERGDAEALAAVFDRLAPELLLVAAHLSGGNAAEDLVQAAFLDAIRQRDRWDAKRPFAPWLVGLLGNHVRRARRERSRQPDASRLLAREVERPEVAAEANECLEAVHAVVERLPRHYRQVLSLRLVHGLELQQIAHSLDVPLGTVKVRLHRGLGLLRRALPAGLGSALAVLLSPGRGLAAVREVVLGSAGAAVGAAAVTGVGIVGLLGVLAMKQVVLGVVVVVALVAAWLGVEAATATREVAEDRGAPPVVAAQLPEPARVQESGADTFAVQPAAEVAVVREAAPTTGGLDVQVVWAADGVPAAGVFVKLSTRGAGSIPEQPTDASGIVAFAGLTAGAYRVVATNLETPVGASSDVVAGQTGSCRLAIDGDVRLKFVVVDAAGAPQAGATVATEDAWRANGDGGERSLGATEGLGVLRYRGLPIRSAWARKPGRQPSSMCTTLPRASQEPRRDEFEIRLVLGDGGCVVLGTVVDPRGRPVPGAQVVIACDDAVGPAAARRALRVVADEGGRFSCDEVPAGERTVVASAAGFAPRVLRFTTSAEVPTDLRLGLLSGATLSGCVTDADGQPLAGVEVHAGPARSLPGIDIPMGGGRSSRTEEGGRYRLEAVAPGETHVRAMIEPVEEQQFVLADGEHKVWDVRQPVARVIRGRVVDREGQPLRGWIVQASDVRPPDRGRAVLGGGITNTEAGGRFEVGGLEAIAYRVFVFARRGAGQSTMGAAARVPRAVVENVRPSANELEIRIDAAGMASGWIEGSLALPTGLQAKATLSLYAKVLRGGGFSVPQERLDAGTTTFRLGPLPAGEYDLLCDVEGRGRLTQRGLQLAPDATLQLPPFAFDAQRPVQLVLRHTDGRAARGADVKLRPDLTPCRETAPGHYESLPVAVGTYEAIVRGPDFAPCTFSLEFADGAEPFERTVPKGTEVQFVLQPPTPRERWVGALTVRITDAVGAEVVRDMVQIDGKQDFGWRLGLLPGTYSVTASAFGDGKVSMTFTVAAEPLRLELQLAK